MKQILQSLLDKAIDEMIKSDGLEGSVSEYTIEVPNNSDHGDFASNIAMKSAKIFRTKPMDIAERIATNLKHPMIKKAEAVMPGFINFFYRQRFFITIWSSRRQRMIHSSSLITVRTGKLWLSS